MCDRINITKAFLKIFSRMIHLKIYVSSNTIHLYAKIKIKIKNLTRFLYHKNVLFLSFIERIFTNNNNCNLYFLLKCILFSLRYIQSITFM